MVVQELRIGNYLKWKESPISAGIKVVTGHDISQIEQGEISFDPIPLNHFWFKEFDFKRYMKPVNPNVGTDVHVSYEKHFVYDNHPYKFQVWSNEGGNFFSFYENFKSMDKKNKYVHMLQNAYFDFTHQELKKKF